MAAIIPWEVNVQKHVEWRRGGWRVVTRGKHVVLVWSLDYDGPHWKTTGMYVPGR